MLPPRVVLRYHGALAHDVVGDTLSRADLLFLPTMGENFGHVIAEALLVGCPVLISDRTPWRHLREAGAGWDLPVDDLEGMAQAVEECVTWGAEEMKERRASAQAYALRHVLADQGHEQRLVLRQACGLATRGGT